MKLALNIKHSLSSYSLRSPINPDLFRTEAGKQQISNRIQARFKVPSLLPDSLSHHELYRQDLHSFEQISRECNQLKLQIKQQLKENKQANIDPLKESLAAAKQTLQVQEQQLKLSKSAFEELLQQIGNQVHRETPVDKDELQNKVLRYHHPVKELPEMDQEGKISHQNYVKQYFGAEGKMDNYQQLTQKFNVADLGRGQKVSGHRGYFLTNNGVKLALALAQYGLDFMEQRGFALYQTPALILQSVLRDSCQLNSIESDMYRFQEDQLCLIATSEQSLAGYHKNETFQPRHLPKKMAGYSSCFRRQAGAHGKDIHGLFRVHQFEKIEQFIICPQEDSQQMMEDMVANAEAFYRSLKIPYRLVDIVSGGLNDAACRKIDLEAWYPGQQRFRELVSVSNCTDYQSRMLQTKYRAGQTIRYPHMLNGTLIAIQRTITCLLEHFYNPQQDVLEIPAALQPYLRASVLKTT